MRGIKLMENLVVYKLGSKVERAGQFEQFVQVSALCNQ